LRRLFPILVAVLASAASAVEAKLHPPPTKPSQPPPYLETAWRALRAGKVELASRVLRQARECWQRFERRCGFSRAEYQELLGIVYLEQGKQEPAVASLRSAVADEPARAEAWFYLGQACYQLGRFEEAIRALERARKVGAKLPGYYALLARAQVRARRPEPARRTLAEGLSRFSDDPSLLKELTLLFARYDFYGAAVQYGRRLLQKDAVFGHLVAADALRGARQFQQALAVLEEAHLRRPDDQRIIERLGVTYAAAGRPLAAARLLERVARAHPSRLALLVAEQLRLCGRARDALRWNAMIPERRQRLVQRASIYLGEQAHDAAARTLLPLFESGALGHSERYRLAYAALRSGRLELAAQAIATLKGSSLAPAAARLSEALARCRTSPWECL